MDLSNVVQFPARQTANLASTVTNQAESTIRRLGGDVMQRWGHVDDWGRNAGLFDVLTALSEIRWDVATGGATNVPARRGALIVINAQMFAASQVFAAFAISRAIDRPVRFVGRPDDTPLGALAQRLGGLIDDPDEVTGAIRANELVLVSAAPTTRPRSVGTIDHAMVGAALAVGAPIIPAATTSSMFNRHARVEIGTAMRIRRHRRGPLAELELSDDVRTAIHLLLDEMGDIGTGTPLDWLPLSGLGGN